MKNEHQHTTANISKLGVSDLVKVCTFNKIFNGLTGEWLRNPSQLILATRCRAFPLFQRTANKF